MPISTDSRYVNLTALLGCARSLDFQQLEKILKPSRRHPLRFNLQDYSIAEDIVVFELNHNTKTLWAHLAAVPAICYVLNIDYPREIIASLLTYAVAMANRNKSTDQQRAQRLAELHRQLFLEFQMSIETLTQNSEDLCLAGLENGKLDVVFSVISLETHLAQLQVKIL